MSCPGLDKLNSAQFMNTCWIQNAGGNDTLSAAMMGCCGATSPPTINLNPCNYIYCSKTTDDSKTAWNQCMANALAFVAKIPDLTQINADCDAPKPFTFVSSSSTASSASSTSAPAAASTSSGSVSATGTPAATTSASQGNGSVTTNKPSSSSSAATSTPSPKSSNATNKSFSFGTVAIVGLLFAGLLV
ncbi:hypothetical protein B0J14DRAFT_572598 [Halenospora varia]|nr:hypothetical protein B0J14DRAFT_572598 [Halenospora varia]